MICGLSTMATRIVVAVVFVICVLGLLQVQSCQRSKQKAAESRLERAQGKAVVESAKDAIATQGAAQERERASDELTVQNEKEIRNATGADVQIHPHVSVATLRGLCRRDAYRDSERCRLLVANPR